MSKKIMGFSRSTDLDFLIYINLIDRKKLGFGRSTDLDLLIYKGNEQKNHGFQLKYRFGFSHLYKLNRQKKDGVGPKYRFGFAYTQRK